MCSTTSDIVGEARGIIRRMARAEKTILTAIDRRDVVDLCERAVDVADMGAMGNANSLLWRAELLSQEVGR